MNSQSYKIKIRATVNGVTVVPTNIAWIHGNDSCLVTPCYKENDYIIVEIIPDCVGDNCIEGWIQFGSDCANCEPIYFKRCFCSSSDDCEECEDCNQYGICQSRCLVDEFCDNGECCNCNETTPCTGNKICNGCKCVCPQGKFEKNGICVECDENTVLDKCHICVNGVIVPIPCDGACDPATGQCVDCLTGGDCSSRLDGKTCCDNKVCVCCAGTVWDPILKICVPQPCVSDDECGPCEKCTPEGCKPIICPPNYKCIEGECVYWPCLSTSCENGADCGPECGCVVYEGVKQCVPCHILECLGLCEQALGCECKGTVCGPVDDCGSVYCDGVTPCLQPGCTCYNNRCVSCENFPCDPDDCTTRYNCGCIDGDCGAADCNDSIDLIKKENCSTDTGCELSAEYTSTKKCMCEAVEFRTKNTKTCTTAGTNGDGTASTTLSDILILKTELFKNNVPYADYLNQISMADNELVSGTITTTISHYVKNNLGVFTKVNPTVVGVDAVSVIDNGVNAIKITTANVKTNAFITELVNGSNVTTNRPTKVVIELRATNVKIDANDCKQYGTKVIATYELDYTTVSTVCAKINNYKTEQLAFLNDSKSIRKPFFVWHKSTTSTFSNLKYDTNNGNYSNSGWFRKQFGSKVGDKWIDKINHPKKHVQDQFNELWNNYNYKVKVDCGCKSNDATLQKVVFCCPKDFEPYYEITDCGRTITIQPFDTCSVNKNLSTLNSTGYTIPIESQTFYWVVINNDTEKVLVSTGGNIVSSAFAYTHPEPITSIRFEQRYQGTPLVSVACPVEYIEEPDLPDFTVTSECGTIVVTKNSGSPAITAVTSNTAGVTFTPSAGNTVWTSTSQPLAVSSSHVVKVAFSGTCVVSKTVNIVCDTIIEAVPTSIRANGECQNGTPPNIKVRALTGFSNAVKFSRDGITYVDPDPLVAPETKPSKTFTNFGAGVYVFYAKETINGVETIATTDVEIVGMLQPTAIFDPSSTCGNAGSLFKIQGGAPNSTWRITGPQFVSPLSAILDSDGKFSVPIIASNAGLYTAEILTDPSNSTCIPQNISATLLTGGGTVSPTIAFQSSSVCQGQPVGFAIRSGQGLIFNLLTANGVIKDQNGIEVTSLVSIENGFNGTFIPSTTGSSTITITSIATNVGNCYILGVQVPYSLTVNSGPIVLNSDAFCTPNTIGNYSAFVQTSGTTTGVTIKGLNATEETPDNWWLRNQTFTVGVDTNVEYTAFGATCGVQGYIDLPVCDEDNVCPQSSLTVTIAADVPTCGEVNRTVSFIESELGYIGGAFYQWISLINGSQESVLESGDVPVNPITLSRTEQTTFYGYEIFLRITLYGGCVFDSNKIYMRANQLPSPTIVGTTSGVETIGTYQYQVNPVVNGTYVWTLNNIPNGTVPIGSTTSNIVTISNFAEGNNTISVTVTDGNGCTASDSLLINVALVCPQTVTITGVGGNGSPSCKDLLGSVQNLGPTTVVSHEWIILGLVVQSGGGSILPFDTSGLEAGLINSITLRVTFSNGCVITSAPYSYTRCACMCNGNTCLTNFITGSGSNDGTSTVMGTFALGTQLEWGFTPGEVTDRFVIRRNGVIILDTGKVSAASSCGCTEVYGTVECDCSTDLFLGDEAGNVGVAMVVGTCDVGPGVGSLCIDGITPVTVSAMSYGSLIPLVQMAGTITLLADGEITVTVTGAACGSGTTQWSYALACP